MKTLLTLVLLYFALNSFGQNNTEIMDSLNQKFSRIQNQIFKANRKTTKIGLSLGIRGPVQHGGLSRVFAEGYISSIDTTLQIDHISRSALILSAVIESTPFIDNRCCFLRNLGFILNINLAQISNDEVNGIFNKEVDGGFGLSYNFSGKVSVAISCEYVFQRSLRDYYIDVFEAAAKKGKGVKLYKDGNVLTNIDKTDNIFYKSNNYFAQSIKLIFYF